jgi:hypothetical protein
MKVADGLFTSKLRFALQLYGKVRRNDEDPMNADLAAIQKVQNKLVRIVNKCKITDKISKKFFLHRVNMLSMNQLNTQMKLAEMLKANNKANCPILFPKQTSSANNITTRA